MQRDQGSKNIKEYREVYTQNIRRAKNQAKINQRRSGRWEQQMCQVQTYIAQATQNLNLIRGSPDSPSNLNLAQVVINYMDMQNLNLNVLCSTLVQSLHAQIKPSQEEIKLLLSMINFRFGVRANQIDNSSAQLGQKIRKEEQLSDDFLKTVALECFNLEKPLISLGVGVIERALYWTNNRISQSFMQQGSLKRIISLMYSADTEAEKCTLDEILNSLCEFCLKSPEQYWTSKSLQILHLMDTCILIFIKFRRCRALSILTALIMSSYSDTVAAIFVNDKLNEIQEVGSLAKNEVPELQAEGISADDEEELQDAVSNFIESLFYGNDYVMETLILSGFMEKIEGLFSMASEQNWAVTARGLLCLQGILLSDNPDVIQIVKESKLFKHFFVLMNRFYSSESGAVPHKNKLCEVALCRCIVNILDRESDYYDFQPELDSFVRNCRERLLSPQLAYDCLSVLVKDPDIHEHWHIYEERNLIEVIQGIAHGPMQDNAKLAETLLFEYENRDQAQTIDDL